MDLARPQVKRCRCFEFAVQEQRITEGGLFLMDRSEEEAKLINMLEIGTIVETHDKIRFQE